MLLNYWGSSEIILKVEFLDCCQLFSQKSFACVWEGFKLYGSSVESFSDLDVVSEFFVKSRS